MSHDWVKDKIINNAWEYYICSECALRKATRVDDDAYDKNGNIVYKKGQNLYALEQFDRMSDKEVLRDELSCGSVLDLRIMQEALK